MFTYFEVLPPAIHFLQGYNADQFQILIQARTYYRFEILLMLGIGFAFQVPLLLLGLQKVGVITVPYPDRQLALRDGPDRGDRCRAAGGGSGYD